MWVQKTSNGKYQFVERYKDTVTGKTHTVSVTADRNTSTERKAASLALAQKIQERQTVTDTLLTFGQLCSLYLQDKQNTLKSVSFSAAKTYCTVAMNVVPPEAIVARITPLYVKKRLSAMNCPATVKNYRLRCVRMIFSWGYSSDLCGDLCKRLPALSTPPTEKHQQYLEPHEIDLLLTALPDEWIPLTRFLILSGLRIGEAIALDSHDVDLHERVIHVRRTYDYINDRMTDTPKTSDSFRDVYMQDQLHALCAEIKSDTVAFFSPRIHYRSYYGALSKAGKTILNRPVHPHTLRHTHTSLLAAEGVPLDVISRRLGHSDSKITRDIYLHVTSKQKAADAALLKSVKIM